MIRRPFLLLVLAFVLGVLLNCQMSSFSFFCLFLLVIFFVISAVQALIQRKILSRYDRILWLMPLFLLLGYVRMDAASTRYPIDERIGEGLECVAYGKVNEVTINDTSTRIVLDHVKVLIDGEEYACRKLLIYSEAADCVMIGNEIECQGTITRFQVPGNPGQFDEAAYYRILGFDYKMWAENIRCTNPSVSMVQMKLSAMKQQLLGFYRESLDEEDYGLVAAMLLGESADLNQEIYELYKRNGIAHMLAISGLHVTLLGMGLYRLLRMLKVRNQIAVVVSSVSIIFYGMMTGFSVSTSRAVIMLTISLCASLVGKTYDVYCSMALSVLLILLQNPLQIQSTGFQLSYSAILGIVLVHSVLEQMLQVRNSCLKAVLFSASIQYATLPLVLYYFYEFPMYAVLLNILIVPMSSLLIGTSLVGGIVGCILPISGGFLMGTVHYILLMIHTACDFFGSLAGCTQTWGRPASSRMIAYLLIAALILAFLYYLRYLQRKLYEKAKEKGLKPEECGTYLTMHGEEDQRTTKENGILVIDRSVETIPVETTAIFGLPKRPKVRAWLLKACIAKETYLFLALCMLAESFLFLPKPVSGVRITMLDVGQGDGICIETGTGHTYLIDGGSSQVKKLAQYRMVPFLKYRGYKELDAVILTHADKDHISGVEELLELEYPIRRIILPDIRSLTTEFASVLELAKAQQIPVSTISKGEQIRDGKVRFTCLNPIQGQVYSNANAGSVVLMLEYGAFQMLFTGDVEAEGEEGVIAYLQAHPMEVDVLKVAHHGSNSTTSEELLQRIRPEWCLISVGKNNIYGHPGEKLMNRLQQEACRVYQTMECGAVTVEVKGKQLNVSTFR